ncbi:MAG: AMP-binding protein, partial [Chloroflexota bacterium]
MTIESSSAADPQSAYDSRPWLRQYPPGVPHTLEFPRETLWDVLESTVATHADATAYAFRGRAMSFNRLKLLAERMSGALASRAGVKQGDVVACLLPNVPHFPVLYY